MFDRNAVMEHQEETNKKRQSLIETGRDGPWILEPDRVNFKHKGFDCLMVRNSENFHWCGYVGLKPGHPLYGKKYSELLYLDVHGGITYTEHCDGFVCHAPEPGEPDQLFWLGFDCAHAWDYVPGWGVKMSMNSTYRTQDWVKLEVKRLAEQL